MEVIQSFTINHTCLKPGIYVSREDKGFTTFDLRITEPNKEPAMAPAAIHSMEHLMATWFRNSKVNDDVVYVMTGTYTVEDMRSLTIECLEWILTQTEVPATRPEACGNYLLHDLPMCKWESARYLDRLQHDFHCEYTKMQITLDDGKVFAFGSIKNDEHVQWFNMTKTVTVAGDVSTIKADLFYVTDNKELIKCSCYSCDDK